MQLLLSHHQAALYAHLQSSKGPGVTAAGGSRTTSKGLNFVVNSKFLNEKKTKKREKGSCWTRRRTAGIGRVTTDACHCSMQLGWEKPPGSQQGAWKLDRPGVSPGVREGEAPVSGSLGARDPGSSQELSVKPGNWTLSNECKSPGARKSDPGNPRAPAGCQGS